MAEEFKLVTEDVSSSLWELVDKELAVERRQVKLTVKTHNNIDIVILQVGVTTGHAG